MSERRGWWQAASVHCRRFLGRLRAGRESRRYRYKGSSQQRHFYFALVLGSLGCLPMMNRGGLLFLQKRHSLRPENGVEWPQQGQSVRPCVTRTSVVCGVNVGRDWGHTPVWAGHGRRVECPWPSEESKKLALISEGPWLCLAFPCGGFAWGGQRSLTSSPRSCGLPHL